LPCLSVQYDLYKESGRVYKELMDAIKALGPWCHALESLWLVKTAASPREVVKHLTPHLHKKDKVLVTPVELDEGWWSQGLTKPVLDWLRSNLNTRRAG
jgi:hypothetical protein